MEWLHELAQNSEIPLLAAFALGLLISVSPCPLATNITAIAYLSKTLNNNKLVLWSGFLYTLGNGISYTSIGLALFWGANKFQVARFFQSLSDIYFAPMLILIGLIMLGVLKLNFLNKINLTSRFSEKYKDKGAKGALILGILFALGFCPYSGALYFGMLIPMTLSNTNGFYLPIVFAMGTGFPVMIFAYLLAFSASKVGKAFNAIRKVETAMRYITGSVFVLAGVYYGLIFLQWI